MRLRGNIAGLFVPLIAANVAAWSVALTLFDANPVLLGAAVLAYTLGLRHAIDADHIAAIDNVTRKLMQARRSPAATGLYFSLGHSAVVWLATIGIAFTANATGLRLDTLRHLGGAVGTGISMLFLFAIAAANIAVLAGIAGAIRRHRRGDDLNRIELDRLFALGGLYARLLRPIFHLVSKSRHMFLVGFLFGLGFDTATEIGILGISAGAAGHGLPVWSILVFPALFTAGMSFVDTLDSALMTHAYGWAFAEPARKLYYNFAVTFFSVVVALGIGGAEALALIHALPWARLPGEIGYGIVAAFAGLWLISTRVYRLKSPPSHAVSRGVVAANAAPFSGI